MPLDEYWFASKDVEKFLKILEKLGYEWDIDNLMEKPILRIWKKATKTTKKNQEESLKITTRKGFYW